MKKSVLITLLMGCLFPLHIQATEFLRFQGSIGDFYSDADPGYDASLGFVPSQLVYFDFQIDTDLDAEGEPDSSFQDNFSVTYLSGSIDSSNETIGVTTTFPEGLTTWLFVTDSLRVGTSWDSLGNSTDESIDTWRVDDRIPLMNGSYFSEDIIGMLTMTYRGIKPPPSIIPIPASLWLFVSGLSLLSFSRRTRI